MDSRDALQAEAKALILLLTPADLAKALMIAVQTKKQK